MASKIQCCLMTKGVCTTASENGHLDCLMFAHDYGCPWDEETCASAASNGQLDCLKYAHKNGCPWE